MELKNRPQTQKTTTTEQLSSIFHTLFVILVLFFIFHKFVHDFCETSSSLGSSVIRLQIKFYYIENFQLNKNCI